jgi:murein DD-endopeptidase MepM/ murein hydrolase activator NlpD
LYNISLDEILTENKIEDPSRIKAGYSLKIPDKNIPEKKEYTIQKGDTLYSIAKNYNADINMIIKENNFDKKSILKIGQTIIIPLSNTAIEQNYIKEELVIANKLPDNSKNSYYWPVTGAMEKLSGKLQGSKISAGIGDVVFSVSSGKVVWEGPYRGFGRVIFVESKSGYVYVYGGNDKTHVNVGDKVEPGSELGKIGLNVYEGKPAMFFAVYKDGQPVDVEKAPRL